MKTTHKLLLTVGLACAVATLPDVRADVWDTSTAAGVTLANGTWTTSGGAGNQNWTVQTGAGNGTTLTAWVNGRTADFNRTVTGSASITSGGSYVVTLGSDVSTNGLRYQNNSNSALTINGDAGGLYSITLTGNVQNENSSTNWVINAPLVLSTSSGNFYTKSGITTTINGAISGNGIAVNINPSASYTGALVFAGNNTYDGNTTIQFGSLSISDAGANKNLGSGSNQLSLAGGTLVVTGTTENARTTNLTANSSINVASGQDFTQSGATAFGTNVLTKSGTGDLVLSNASNTSSAGSRLDINGGDVRITNVGALGSAMSVRLNNGTPSTSVQFQINYTSAAFARNLESGGSDGNNVLSFLNTSGMAGFSGNITLTRSMFVRTDVASTNATISGNITDGSVGRQLTKSGAGTLLLTGTNNTFGGLAVNEGTVLVNGTVGLGTGTGAGNLSTVNNGAVLGGNGTILHAVNIANGTLSPGNSIGTINTGNLTIGAVGTLDIELGRDGVTPVSDRTNVTGSVTLDSGSNLQLTLYTGLTNPAFNDIFFLVSNDSTDAVTGVFTSLNGVATTLTEGSTFAWNSQDWQITYLADFGTSSFTGGNDIALKVIPEPTTWALMVGSLSAIMIFRKRRKAC